MGDRFGDPMKFDLQITDKVTGRATCTIIESGGQKIELVRSGWMKPWEKVIKIEEEK